MVCFRYIIVNTVPKGDNKDDDDDNDDNNNNNAFVWLSRGDLKVFTLIVSQDEAVQTKYNATNI